MKILDVGQCGVDGPRMKSLLHAELGATVVDAKTAADAKKKLAEGGYDVVLVNRVLAADGSPGMDVIDEILKSENAPPVMLVSDREDAQQAAVAKGALRGFGKSVLEEQETLEVIRRAAKG
jgi:DNA-binding response OmpR family regulator